MSSKKPTYNEPAQVQVNEEAAQPFNAKRFAQALAVANGHSHPEEYAAKVAEAFKTLAPDDTHKAIDDARSERADEE